MLTLKKLINSVFSRDDAHSFRKLSGLHERYYRLFESIEALLSHIFDRPNVIVSHLYVNVSSALVQELLLHQLPYRRQQALNIYQCEFNTTKSQYHFTTINTSSQRKSFRSDIFFCLVSGPTQGDKSHIVVRILDDIDTMVQPLPNKVIYYFAEYQPAFERNLRVKFRQAMFTAAELKKQLDCLLVCNNLMSEIDDNILTILTRGPHHIHIFYNIYTSENFSQESVHENNYFACKKSSHFRNISDIAQFTQLAQQIYPNNARFACESYTVLHFYLIIISL